MSETGVHSPRKSACSAASHQGPLSTAPSPPLAASPWVFCVLLDVFPACCYEPVHVHASKQIEHFVRDLPFNRRAARMKWEPHHLSQPGTQGRAREQALVPRAAGGRWAQVTSVSRAEGGLALPEE